jgi:hypothetical protein
MKDLRTLHEWQLNEVSFQADLDEAKNKSILENNQSKNGPDDHFTSVSNQTSE